MEVMKLYGNGRKYNSEIECLKSEVGGRKLDVRRRKSENWKSIVGNKAPKSNVWIPKSEVGN